jgi:hypothetical protein
MKRNGNGDTFKFSVKVSERDYSEMKNQGNGP